MIAAFAALLLASGQIPPTPTLQEVLNRYITWRGGDRFKQLRSVQSKRTIITGGLQGTEQVIVASDGTARVDTDLGPVKQVQVITPGQSWESTPSGQVESMALVDVLSIVRKQELLFADTLQGRHGARLALAASTVFGARTLATVRVGFGDDDVCDMLIDPTSGELAAFRIVEERQQRFEALDDWREVDGVKMPFRETTTSDVPSDSATARVVSIEVDKPIREGTFAQPTPLRKTHFADNADSSGWINFDLFGGNRIFIPGRVNGRDIVLLLDSGASVSTVDSGYAKTLGVLPRGKISAGGSGGIGTAGFAAGVNVQVANLTIQKLTVASIDLDPVARRIGHAIPFVLGDELFNELIVDIDFEHRRIAFREPASFVMPNGAVIVPLHRLIGNRSVPVSIDGQAPIECEFDLGNGSPLDLYPAYYLAHETLTRKRTSQVLAGAVGGFHPETVASLARVGFARVTFSDVPTNFTRDVASAANSNRVLGNIGLPMLARFRLLIDYSHDRITAVPIGNAAAIKFPKDRVGLALSKTSKGLSVDFVSPASPAERAGIKIGEVIAGIDGKRAEDWPDAEIAALRFREKGQRIRLELANGSVRWITARAFF